MSAACVAALSACATAINGEPGGIEKGNPPAQDIQSTYGYYGSSSNVADYMTDGSVQIFSLDGPPDAPTPMQAYQPGPTATMSDGGMPAMQDPNVTVYPLDDMYQPYYPPQGYQPGTVPPIRPPSDMRQDYPSPFNY